MDILLAVWAVAKSCTHGPLCSPWTTMPSSDPQVSTFLHRQNSHAPRRKRFTGRRELVKEIKELCVWVWVCARAHKNMRECTVHL
jgi:hypothetical protein